MESWYGVSFYFFLIPLSSYHLRITLLYPSLRGLSRTTYPLLFIPFAQPFEGMILHVQAKISSFFRHTVPFLGGGILFFVTQKNRVYEKVMFSAGMCANVYLA